MLNLKQYMDKVDVKQKRTVQGWVKNDLIPGIVPGKNFDDTLFPESTRRPYQNSKLKAGIGADRIRTHILKACITRQHITKEICHASPGEFNGYIRELEASGLIRTRVEDNITYFDSTRESEAHSKERFSALSKFILKAIEAAAKGATAAALDKMAG